MYHIFREIPGIGIRYLDSPEKPYNWVKDTRRAYSFSDPNRLADELDAQVVEIEDSWSGSNNR